MPSGSASGGVSAGSDSGVAWASRPCSVSLSSAADTAAAGSACFAVFDFARRAMRT
ncbi:MAG: hypothetical protein H7067_00105 [Burkholderiales bacterium]|nr:hypothetical protein [Opitutaceae bacterium]